jgi:hypothetical protein
MYFRLLGAAFSYNPAGRGTGGQAAAQPGFSRRRVCLARVEKIGPASFMQLTFENSLC